MGDLIDTVKCDKIYRCNQVKLEVVWITLIGSPISFFLLIFCIYRMVSTKRKLSFLTRIILLIFSSELVLSVSKIIQVFKYCFHDYREEKHYDGFNGRALICQIQLVLAVYSDYCSLLSTFLLSFRCYDVIHNKNKIFDKMKNVKISLYGIIIGSFILGMAFLFADIGTSDISYKFDVRDRCCYWCWLDQGVSIVCFFFYLVILIANIIYACKTVNYLKKGYEKLLEENGLSKSKANLDDPLIGNEKDNKDDISSKIYKNLTSEERKRMEEIQLMKKKCTIYPWVTISLWIYALLYRVCEAGFFWEYDHGEDPDSSTKQEQQYFETHPFAHFLVQFMLVLHTFVTSLRGVFYCGSFIVFEEKRFFNCFRRLCHKKIIEFKEENENEIVKDSNCAISSLSDANDNNTDNKEMNESKELNDRDSKVDDNIEMSNNEYHVE